MATVQLQRLSTATAIFDPVDRFARDRGVEGLHPRPQGRLKYYLIGEQSNGLRKDYNAPRELLTIKSPSGHDLFFQKIKFQNGLTHKQVLDPGEYVLKVLSERYQTVVKTINLPDASSAISLELEPSYNYIFPTGNLAHGGGPTLLRGVVHAVDGIGVTDIQVKVVNSSNEYITDDTGQWVLVFNEDQPSGDVTVEFTMPDNTTEQVSAVNIIQGKMTSLGQAGLRGRVINSAAIGLANVTISVFGHTATVKTDSEGRWNYYFGLNQGQDLVSVTATLVTGESDVQNNIQVQARQLVDVPDFQF